MNAATRKNARRNRGQGMTEYIIIVALIAIASIGIVTLFGDNIRNLFGMSSDALTGESSVANKGKKSTTAQTVKNLKSFAQNNG